MNNTTNPFANMSKHRVDALTDGIFAVAMTLLVIDLKIPESMKITSNIALINAVLHLIPKFISWFISFFVLGLFWYSHHRAFHFVSRIDGKLVTLNIFFLGAVSLMPFASALAGEYILFSAMQVFYSATMIGVAVTSMLIWRYLYHHPEMCIQPMGKGIYLASKFRISMLILISALAIPLSYYFHGAGNMAFMLMFVIGPISRRIEAKYASQSTGTLPSA